MRILTAGLDLEPFWAKLHQAQQALLLLDFDGTLAPFVVDPAQARPYPGVVGLLQRIAAAQNTRLVVISGRDIDSLIPCLQVDFPLELWGCHGWQRKLPQGRVRQRALSPEARGLLAQAAESVRRAGWAQQLESKPVALALHWRGLAAAEAEALRQQVGRLWQELTLSGKLQLKDFAGGFELRCPEINKGTAVEQLLLEIDPATPIAYLGDDLTDEDAFRALAGRGLRILVREDLRETSADLWLQPPGELLWFLQRWNDMKGDVGEGD